MTRSKVKNLLLLKQIHKAVAQIKKGKLEKALESLDRAEKSARSSNSTDALYYILFTRGGILYSAKKYDDALETYEKALEVGGALLEKDPENSDYQHYMGTTLSNMGNLLKSKGDAPRAAESYALSRDIYEKLLVQDPENSVFRSYAGENLNNYGTLLAETASYADGQLGNCLKQMGPERAEEAKEKLEKALKMQEALLNEQPENEKIKEAITLTRERLEDL